MALNLTELTDATRARMLDEFELEELSGKPYRSEVLSPVGLAVWPSLMRQAIQAGDDDTLQLALHDPDLWNPYETAIVKGVQQQRRVNMRQASVRLATNEFNTWYVRGLSGLLLDEGMVQCEVYRAGHPKWEPSECSKHEGEIVAVQDVYAGHRRRYWPVPDPTAFSIPFQPGCHHSIRRPRT